MDVRPPLPRSADAYHSRTTAGVSARSAHLPKEPGAAAGSAHRSPGTAAPSWMIPQPRTRVVAERFTAKTLVQPGAARDIGLHCGKPPVRVRRGLKCRRRRLPQPGRANERCLIAAGRKLADIAETAPLTRHLGHRLPGAPPHPDRFNSARSHELAERRFRDADMTADTYEADPPLRDQPSWEPFRGAQQVGNLSDGKQSLHSLSCR